MPRLGVTATLCLKRNAFATVFPTINRVNHGATQSARAPDDALVEASISAG
jgi:hypothetical protein